MLNMIILFIFCDEPCVKELFVFDLYCELNFSFSEFL